MQRRAAAVAEGGGAARPRSRSCSARRPRSPCTASASSAARRSRSCSSCRSRCPGSSPAWRCNSFFTFWSIDFGLWTIVVGHATFCIVDRLQQRARAAAAHAGLARRGVDGSRRRRLADVPLRHAARRSRRRSSRAALLAFALSFDEVIVTTFTAGAQNTLPIWIFGKIRLGQQLPEVNVVVFRDPAGDDHPGRARAAPDARDRHPPHGRRRRSHRERPQIPSTRTSSAASGSTPRRARRWRC